jgi:protoporphyrinogen oxidase
MDKPTAIIVGAGPAGLTAAYELLQRTDIKPILFELTGEIGGIAKTVNYKGNRMDMGGHRFFSKSDRVMNWWLNILPLQGATASNSQATGMEEQGNIASINISKDGPDPDQTEKVMLIRKRLSRILFERKFYAYPINLSRGTLANLGLVRIFKIGVSYLWCKLFHPRKITNLEEFFISRFGKELYQTFFKDYTEKVWGVPCSRIQPEWGVQRVKSLSILKAVVHALKSLLPMKSSIAQKNVETSLIELFLYPKYGPGQMWEETARIITEQGGEIHLNHKVTGISYDQKRVTGIKVINSTTGEEFTQNCDYLFSTMPVKELVQCLGENVPAEVQAIAQGLVYRDFMTVGLLLRKLKLMRGNIPSVKQLIPDNWIYVQERDVKLGRLQIFNNWSPYLVQDPDTVWLGLEYFCNQGDESWNMPDQDFIRFAIQELSSIDIITPEDVLDSTLIRVPYAYPAYFGAYEQFDIIRNFADSIENMFLIGRNGMHRYNNQDHSMLTAMVAVENIVNRSTAKDNIWAVNAEQEYHETVDAPKVENSSENGNR